MSNVVAMNAVADQLNVSYEVNGQTVQLDPQMVRRYLVQGNGNVSDQEVLFFIQLCKAQKLNPLVKDAYLIKYGSQPAQTVVSKGAYMQRAFTNPDYLSKEDGIVVLNSKKEVVHKEGNCVYPGETLVGGWCRVHYMRRNRDCTAYREVAMSEYGKGQSSWKSMPGTMINKVAVAQALREAFPLEYQGLYEESEMVASGAVPAAAVPGMAKEPEKQPQPQMQPQMQPERPQVVEMPAAAAVAQDVDASGDPLVPREKLLEMFNLAQSTFGREDGNEMIRTLLQGVGMTSTRGMRQSVYEQIMGRLEEACDLRRSVDSLLDNDPGPENIEQAPGN